MEKEFVPYELAVKLKELGFDEPCMAVYFGNGENELFTFNPAIAKENTERMVELGHIPCPTYSQAFGWFREKYDINNCISYSRLEDNNWYYQYYKSGLDGGFETYEEAELACLEKLIELVEQKEK